jgi:hypothetical protein
VPTYRGRPECRRRDSNPLRAVPTGFTDRPKLNQSLALLPGVTDGNRTRDLPDHNRALDLLSFSHSVQRRSRTAGLLGVNEALSR